MEKNKENIKKLIESKDKFLEYAKGVEEKFNGPSAYFYRKIINKIRKNDYEKLFSDDYFIELLYATLACWGMHRMDGNTRMKEFNEFKEAILENKSSFIKLSRKKLREVNIDEIKGDLLKIFRNLHVMARENSPKLVANSKIMHFLLPDLIPPIDKGNVIFFFYGRYNKDKKNKKYIPNIKNKEEEVFINVLKEFQNIANELDLKDEDLKNKDKWNTSIPKLIDNAIIGYNKDMLKNKNSPTKTREKY